LVQGNKSGSTFPADTAIDSKQNRLEAVILFFDNWIACSGSS